jgi:small subunit ribosomal protein S3Ae
MAVGKNKRLTRGGKKGAKKKSGDPFLKKEWYDLKAPSMFNKRNCGKTLVSKTAGTKIASAGLAHRVCEINLGDLYENEITGQDEDQGFKKMKLCVEDIQGRNCLLDFHGMCYTRDKLCYFVRKWQTLIEGNVDVKTTDGYSIRVFCIGFTKARPEQRKANCYAQSSQIRKIRKRMVDTIQEECSKASLKENVKKFIASSIEKDITKKCNRVFPLKDVSIRKVKVLKKPKFDITKLMEVHQGEEGDAGADMLRPEAAEAKNVLTEEI